MAEFKTNATRIVKTAKIPFESLTYDPGDKIDAVSVAEKMGLSVDIVYKTLVTQGKSKSFYVFVIKADGELDLKKAAACVGEKSVEMIAVRDINKITGYIRGGCSPIGMKKQYKTLIDIRAKDLDTFVVSAGKIGYQLRLSPVDLATLIGGEFADILM